MNDHEPHLLEHVLGAKSKVAALRVLINSKIGFSGSSVAKRSGMGLLAIQNALADLEGLGLVEVERGSVEHRYRLNFKHHLVVHGLRALFEAERGMQKALAHDLRPLLKGHVVSAGLFGSFAHGRAVPGSDIDLLVIVETLKEKERVSALLSDELPKLSEQYGLPIQPVIYERRRLVNSSGVDELLETAGRDWVMIAGEDIKRIRASFAASKPGTRRRSA
ncbi:MAG: polymerase beta, Nucleotidyltransferase [Acidobacteriota bacterium]|jgi:predicted nucleotidyltransferase|nr:polymerase beta, Nucleotidyltransferase [Acidobacteriota bacterium]